MRLLVALLAALLIPLALPHVADAVEISAEQARFFETRIRPVLAEHCFECHGADVQENNLRLDSLQHMLDGGDFGRAVVPGEPDRSLMLLAIRHEDTLRMPPESKLPTRAIIDLTRWVESGAPWPDQTAVLRQRRSANSLAVVSDEDRQFWAFKGLQVTEPPTVAGAAWARTPVDQFLYASLRAERLTPAGAADRRTWIRRATFDLHGVPPTPAEASAFLEDASPGAYAAVIDRLLASPRYGERWGRHWLDVARYADSNGLDENICYANAYHYRDYVIHAFNSDKPYDVFLREQVAGDLLPPAEDAEARRLQLIGTGFLALGPKMLACDDGEKMRMDIVDEQLNTLAQAFLGLTVGCARCHDHKFDPIPMTDYYALAGIFRSTKTMENYKVVAKWFERPVPTPESAARRKQLDEELAALRSEASSIEQQARQDWLATAGSQAGAYLMAAAQRADHLGRVDALREQTSSGGDAWLDDAIVVEAEQFTRGTANRLDAGYGEGIGVIASGATGDAEYDIEVPSAGYYALASRYAAAEARPMTMLVNGGVYFEQCAGHATGGWFPEHQRWHVEGLVDLRAGPQTLRFERTTGPIPHVDRWALKPIKLTPLVERPSGEKLYQPWLNALALKLFEAGDQLTLAAARRLLPGANDALEVPVSSRHLYPDETIARLNELDEKIAAVEAAFTAEPVAMGVTEGPEIGDMPLHHRGNYFTPGPIVQRGYLRVLAEPDDQQLQTAGSGRLQLAHWMTRPNSRASSLAARVMVNRIWRWHFGRGIVRSTDNFGRLGEVPSHPALLDYLANYFIEHAWSVKALHRLIMNSAAYRMSSAYDGAAAAVDRDNRLLWRMNRRRLEAESLRDSLLVLSGTLDDAMGGTLLKVENHAYVTTSGTAITDEYDQPRRSVYLPVVRSAMYEPLATFDFPDPAMPNGDRPTTTIAPQALFLTNSQLVHRLMGAMADKLLASAGLTDADRIRAAYEQIFTRVPSENEAADALRFVDNYAAAVRHAGEESAPAARRRAWQALCRVLVSTNEFIYIE